MGWIGGERERVPRSKSNNREDQARAWTPYTGVPGGWVLMLLYSSTRQKRSLLLSQARTAVQGQVRSSYREILD
jgi:hypothetical protein